MAHPERLVAVEEISKAYSISRHHLVKVVQRLVELELIVALRGRNGGMRLAKKPEEINVGQMVRGTEPNFNLVECFDEVHNTCPISSVCGLKGALYQAREAFLKVLDSYSLADFQSNSSQLIPLWELRLRDSEKVVV
jgi:Rrf2 family nitric oxide-sensitive transcriptional repressor